MPSSPEDSTIRDLIRDMLDKPSESPSKPSFARDLIREMLDTPRSAPESTPAVDISRFQNQAVILDELLPFTSANFLDHAVQVLQSSSSSKADRAVCYGVLLNVPEQQSIKIILDARTEGAKKKGQQQGEIIVQRVADTTTNDSDQDPQDLVAIFGSNSYRITRQDQVTTPGNLRLHVPQNTESDQPQTVIELPLFVTIPVTGEPHKTILATSVPITVEISPELRLPRGTASPFDDIIETDD